MVTTITFFFFLIFNCVGIQALVDCIVLYVSMSVRSDIVQ